MKIFLPLLLASGLAIADDAAFLRCRSIADGPARLACYDAVAVPVAGTGAGNTSNSSANVTSQPSPGAQSPSTQQKSDQFGLEAKVSNNSQLDAIESNIAGSFEGWSAKSNIKLTNGQVWQISDDSSRAHYIDNPKVRIRRGALGSFYLEIQGTNISPRVRRVQ